jgi:hypothetical protein
VSRAVTRLQLTSLRVAAIGLLGTVVIALGVLGSLWVLPSIIGAAIFVLAWLLAVVSAVFGRVVIFAATGQWLQRRLLPRLQSESVILLLGVVFWILCSSLPYLWPFVQAGLLVTSLGLALTARYRIVWKKTQPADD